MIQRSTLGSIEHIWEKNYYLGDNSMLLTIRSRFFSPFMLNHLLFDVIYTDGVGFRFERDISSHL